MSKPVRTPKLYEVQAKNAATKDPETEICCHCIVPGCNKGFFAPYGRHKNPKDDNPQSGTCDGTCERIYAEQLRKQSFEHEEMCLAKWEAAARATKRKPIKGERNGTVSSTSD